MESKIDSIATFLSDDKKSQLGADEQTLNHVFQNIVAIQENDAEKMATLVEIKQIKNEALKNTQFFNRQIQSVLKSLSEKDCKSKIENKINDIGEYLFQYSYSVMIYSKACLLDLLIAKVEARQYINSVRNDLREKKEQFNMTIRNCEIELEIYLLTAKAINYSEPVIVKVAPYISPWGSVARIVVGCLGMSLKDNARECVETRLRQVIRNGGNDEVLTKTIESIEEYNKLMNNPIEVICTSDSAYFKVLPLKKTMRSQSE
jgi:hypothetical protein